MIIMAKAQVLVADDHELVREGICKLLELYDEVTVVGEAGGGQETIDKVRHLFPDLVLLDLNMPDLNGIKTAKKIKEISPDIKILILTIHDEDEYIYEVTKVGAEGYVQKDIKPRELRKAIQDILNGQKVFPATLENRVAEESLLQYEDEDIQELSNREYEVMELLAQGMSNKKIAEELYISEKTVKNHVSNILKKLKVNDRTQAVILALKKGIVSLS